MVECEKIEVGAYYFPNFHRNDPLNEQTHGRGWSEWELVKNAKSRFPGHRQPKIPLWGYEDESDAKVMEHKISEAVSHALDYFIFDWYWYENGPILNGCLDNGFLNASNRNELKFALMWANHDWMNTHPSLYSGFSQKLYSGEISEKAYETMIEYVIEHYFSQPNYYKIDGAPYFSIYQIATLFKMFSSVNKTAERLSYFREKVKQAGFPDLHLNLILWQHPVLPCERENEIDFSLRLRHLGISSTTSYVWVHHVILPEMRTPYNEVFEKYCEEWKQLEKQYPGVPYFPNVSVGWDPSPRTSPTDMWDWRHGYPYSAVISENTPENFEKALRVVKTAMNERKIRTFNINSWNEWTEGSMLEPEAQYGNGYLNAIRNVFGKKESK